MKIWLGAARLGFALIVSVPLFLGQTTGTYTQIDVPGAVSTSAWGINTAGDIVGYYSPDGSSDQGFVLHNGTFLMISTGAFQTFAYGINDNGQVVGDTVTAGFLYDIPTQTFTSFQYPGALYTLANAINNAGLIVGSADTSSSGDWVGFQYDGQTFTTIALPNAKQVSVTAIKTSGESLVTAFFQNRYINYLYTQNKLIKFAEYYHTELIGINDNNTLVGAHFTGSSVGILYMNGTLQTLRFPNAKYTVATAVNNGGEVVGWFYDVHNHLHGFSWVPNGQIR